ncbi:MAG: hypothetical protein DRR19_28780 [Candidatus Parabeggiatoa sp. nov. 1]|nr:MAG: hypothetical protein DRR19_28780 [Gammaproteobacteria bacterium]
MPEKIWQQILVIYLSNMLVKPLFKIDYQIDIMKMLYQSYPFTKFNKHISILELKIIIELSKIYITY